MEKTINLSTTTHQFEKSNLVTQRTAKGSMFDAYRCKYCGLEGKRFGLGNNLIVKSGSEDCSKAPKVVRPAFIEVVECMGSGHAFSNLKPRMVRKTYDPPKGQKEDAKGVWVQGNGELVKLLVGEYKEFNDDSD